MNNHAGYFEKAFYPSHNRLKERLVLKRGVLLFRARFGLQLGDAVWLSQPGGSQVLATSCHGDNWGRGRMVPAPAPDHASPCLRLSVGCWRSCLICSSFCKMGKRAIGTSIRILRPLEDDDLAMHLGEEALYMAETEEYK